MVPHLEHIRATPVVSSTNPPNVMMSHKFLTLLGLAVSSVTALNIPNQQAELAKQLTVLICEPAEQLPDFKGMESLHDHAHADPTLAFRQLRTAVHKATGSLQDLDQKHTPYLLQSILGYHETLLSGVPHDLRNARLGIYENAIYSRLVDMYHAYPDNWQKNVESAISDVKNSLNAYANHFQQFHLPRMGSPEKQEQYLKAFEQVRSQINKASQSFATIVVGENSIYPKERVASLEYLELAEINRQLQATNKAGVSPAIILDGNLRKLVQQRMQQFDHLHSHPSPAYIGHIHQVPAAAPQVAAKA